MPENPFAPILQAFEGGRNVNVANAQLGAKLGFEESLLERKLAAEENIQKLRLKGEAEKQQREFASKALDGMNKIVDDAVAKGGPAAGVKAAEALLGANEAAIRGLATMMGVKPGFIIGNLRSRPLAGVDAATQGAFQGDKAKAEAPGAAEKARAVSEAQVQGQKAAGGGPSEEVKTFRFPDGQLRPVNMRDTAAVKQATQAGAIPVPVSVQATTLGGLTGESAKSTESLRANIRDTISAVEELETVAKAFEKTPGAAGIQGLITEKAGGLLQQFDNLAGTNIAGATGMKPEDVTKVRTQARVVVSQMLSTITKETSRFTDEERRRAEATLKALDVESSPQQIKAALQTSTEIMERGQTRNLDRLRVAAGVDLSKPEDIQKFGEVLLKNGFKAEDAAKAIIQLQDRLGVGPMK